MRAVKKDRAGFARQWQYHLMLLPGLVVIFIFHYIPLYGVVIAFQKYNPALGFFSRWVGLDNFRFLFSQPGFVRTIGNTLFISLWKIFLNITVPVAFALLLNEVRRTGLKKAFQSLVYLPHFLSWVILAGVFIDILGAEGIVNRLITSLGGGPVSFLGDPKVFPWTMIITDVWKGFGFGTVIYLASITGIDPELYEAAIVDGALRWKQTIHITLPLMAPIITLMLVLSLGGVLGSNFDQIYNLYSPVVYPTGDTIDTYMFRLGIQQAQFSLGAAVGLARSVVAAVLIAGSQYLANRFAGYRVF
jgi:putative aldouronate transport system permease protein